MHVNLLIKKHAIMISTNSHANKFYFQQINVLIITILRLVNYLQLTVFGLQIVVNQSINIIAPNIKQNLNALKVIL